ncbi:MAG: dockerin type I domain-containing protein, partial [Peptococcaceae bacterium]|nr:dockerin type I domain-containing protein [Peptococcaceae bacterium]
DKDNVPGDTTGKGYVDLIDLSNVIDMFGYGQTTPGWNTLYKFFDFNGNGRIDIYDIVYVAQRIVG